jgi:hypothetical protein
VQAMKTNNINLRNQKMALEKATFERKDFITKTIKVLVVDSIESLTINGQNLSFFVKRKVTLDPQSVFDLEIVFSYSASIDDESYKTMQSEGKEFAENDYISIINNSYIPQTASMIISSLTSINGGNPLITPPVFCKNK